MVLGDGGHDDWVLVRPTTVSDSRRLFYLPHVLGDHLPHWRSDSAKPRAHAPPMVKRHGETIGEDHVCCFEACRHFISTQCRCESWILLPSMKMVWDTFICRSTIRGMTKNEKLYIRIRGLSRMSSLGCLECVFPGMSYHVPFMKSVYKWQGSY